MQKKTTKIIRARKSSALPYGFQQKLKSVSSPEDIMRLAQELAARGAIQMQPEPEPEEEIVEEEEMYEDDEFEEEPAKPAPRGAGTRSLVVRATTPAPQEPEAPSYTRAPWYEHGMGDTEAMVIDLYAKGLTTRDIVNHLKRAHNIDLSQPAISSITDKVFPFVKDWQSRPLSPIYPIMYLDGIHFKVRDAGKIVSKVAYIALGFNIEGQKEILGIWVSDTEGAKFWAHVLNDLKNRGVEDILIACVDGLKGFPEAIRGIFPQADVQVCVVHQIRHTLMFISHKDRKRFAEDLRSVYTASNEERAMQALQEMQHHWPQYASYLRSWEKRWPDLAPFFGYPDSIKRMIYTTNTIENLNRQFRKVTKTTQLFPSDDALIKLLWLAQCDITEGWRVTARNWGEVVGEFNYLFPDRIQF